MKLPAFQFYPGDWRKDPGVQSLGFEERGVWFEIICLMHESDDRGVLTLNGKPMPDEALARLLGISTDLLKQILTTLLNHGVASRDEASGALICRRMVRDENLRKIRKEAGKLGGNPVLLNQKSTTGLNQKSTPSSSSSSSTSVLIQDNASALSIDRPALELLTIYEAYPRKVGRTAAIKAIAKAAKICPDLLAKTTAYAAAVSLWGPNERQFIPHPATWFNRGSYDDDPATWARQASSKGRASFA